MSCRPPNIVIVIADDTTPHYHACYGGRTPTPNIDAIAARGVRFNRACGVSPLCNPSRFSIFTGCYPGRAASASDGCSAAEPYSIQQNAELTPGMHTIATLLRSAGYFTGHVGKWHSNFSYAGDREWPVELHEKVDPDDPAVDAKLREVQAWHQQVIRDCAGFEHVAAVHWGNIGHGRPEALGFHNPAWKTDAALAFIDEAARGDRPFYLHLANTVPHGPDVNKSLGKDDRYTMAGKLSEPPKSHPPDETVTQRLREAGIETDGPIGGVNTGVVMIDDQIGAIQVKLRELGIEENTILIYTADHGIFGKGSCYLGGFLMPLVMQWPAGVAGGQVIDAPVSLVDILPTLLEAAQVTAPAGHRCDGVSFLPLVQGRCVATRDLTYQEMGVCRAVLKGKWHYIAFRYPRSILEKMEAGEFEMPVDQSGYGDSWFGDLNFRYKPAYFEPEQLYDVEADPLERNNLANDPACAAVLAELRAELGKIVAGLPGPFPMEAPAFMESDRYRAMVEKRRARLASIAYYPQGFDAEVIYNRNEPDPLA